MTVEAATYIDDLNASYPASTDPKSEGDNHIRLIKSTVKATFPNITEPVTHTALKLNNTIVSIKQFGVVGDGVADDTAALNLAFASGNRIVEGENLTCKVTAPLTAITSSNLTIRNLTINSSTVTSGTAILSFSGVRNANISLTTANALVGATTLTVGSTSTIAVGQYLFLGSDAYYSSSQTDKVGQIVRVKSKTSTVITLHSPVLYNFRLTDNAYIQPLNTAKGIRLENVNMIGNATATVLGNAVDAETCEGFRVENCSFSNYNYGAILLDRSINSRVVNSTFTDFVDSGEGYSYGVVVAYGCCDTLVDGCSGDNIRHIVTTGGNNGVNIFTRAVNNYATAMRDSGLDAHCNSDYTDYSNNHIEISAAIEREGVIIQGGNVTVKGNTLINCLTGVKYQSLSDGQEVCIVISDNIIDTSTNVGRGIHIETYDDGSSPYTDNTTQINALIITGNVFKGSATSNHILINAKSAHIFNTTITGNVCELNASSASLYIKPVNGYKIDRVTITGNVFKVASGGSSILLEGDSTSSINGVTVSGNSLSGGNYGVYATYANSVITSGNRIASAAISDFYQINTTNSYSADYTEGNWTPVVSASTTAPLDVVYVLQLGRWTRCGNSVTVHCVLRFTATNSGTGYPVVTGLPFSEGTQFLPPAPTGLATALTDQNARGYVSLSTVIFPGTTYTTLTTSKYLTFTATYEINP